MLPACGWNAVRLLKACCQHVFSMWSASSKHVVRILPAYCWHVASILPACCGRVASMLSVYFQHVYRISSITTLWPAFGWHFVSILTPCGWHMDDTFSVCCQHEACKWFYCIFYKSKHEMVKTFCKVLTLAIAILLSYHSGKSTLLFLITTTAKRLEIQNE